MIAPSGILSKINPWLEPWKASGTTCRTSLKNSPPGDQPRPRRSLPYRCRNTRSSNQHMCVRVSFSGGAAQAYAHSSRMSGMGRLEPIDCVRANGRNRCSPLIDGRHAKVWISISQRPSINPDANRTSNPTASPEASSSQRCNLGCNRVRGRGPVTTRPRIISAYSSTCSDMASASSTSMPR
jgi:hypothetical protein